MQPRLLLLVPTLLFAAPAYAAPGLGDEVLPATVVRGETSAEINLDTLRGGPAQGEDALQAEVALGLTDKFQVRAQAELTRQPGSPRRLDELSLGATLHLADRGPTSFALYGGYSIGVDGEDSAEARLIVQHRQAPLEIRFNLVAEKPMAAAQSVELSYAVSVDLDVTDGVAIGALAFGDLGTLAGPHANEGHYIGPAIEFELGGGAALPTLNLAYLFALGNAREDASGQLRAGLEFEF